MIMIYQQYATAIKEAYAGHPDLAHQAEMAETCRQWLESLAIDANLRAALVEQIQTLEDTFKELLKKSG